MEEDNCRRDKYGYSSCRECNYEECNYEDIKRAESIDKYAREYNTGWPTNY